MAAISWAQIGLVLLIVFLLSIPVGRYLGAIVMDRKTWFDRLFNPVDALLYSLIGRQASSQPTDWKRTRFTCLPPIW